jgi:coenzyme F420-reducing hydrogenase gamma subunit
MFYDLSALLEDVTAYRPRGEIVPAPNSCAVCGGNPRIHGMSYSNSRSAYHYYEAPSNAVRLLRMKARRATALDNS